MTVTLGHLLSAKEGNFQVGVGHYQLAVMGGPVPHCRLFPTIYQSTFIVVMLLF